MSEQEPVIQGQEAKPEADAPKETREETPKKKKTEDDAEEELLETKAVSIINKDKDKEKERDPKKGDAACSLIRFMRCVKDKTGDEQGVIHFCIPRASLDMLLPSSHLTVDDWALLIKLMEANDDDKEPSPQQQLDFQKLIEKHVDHVIRNVYRIVMQ